MDNPAFVIDYSEHTGKNDTDKSNHKTYTYEEAVALTGVGKFHYIQLLVCGFSFMGVMCELMGVSLILPTMKCELKPTQSEQGFLTSAAFMGIVLSSHFYGFLSDTWGRARTLSWALMTSVVVSIISALSVNIWMLIVFRFLNGFVISCGQACVFSYIGEFHSNKSRGQYVTLLAVFMPLALIYLPAMAIFILPLEIDAPYIGMKFSSWRLLLLLNPIFPLLASIGFFLLPEAPKYLLIHGESDRTLSILRKMFAINTGMTEDEYPVKAIVIETGGASLTNVRGFTGAVKLIWTQTTPLFHKERYLHTINICWALFVVYGVSQGLFMWFPIIMNQLIDNNGLGYKVCYSIDTLITDSAESGGDCGKLDNFLFITMIVIGVVFFILHLFFSYTIDCIGKKNLLYCWLLITLICTIVVHYVTNIIVAIVVITLIMAMGNCGGIIGTLSMEFFPTNVNAMGMSFIMMIGRLGAMAGSFVIGQVIFSNCDMVFWVLCGLVCLEMVLFTFLPERKRPKKVKTPKEVLQK